MAYLDVNPMIMALRSSPDHFAFSSGSLHHIPSGHRFKFDRSGRVNIQARCACSYLEVSNDQQMALFETFNDWHLNYWRPLQINTQFADHFTLPLWRRLLVALTGRLHRALLVQGRERHVQEVAGLPAE
jgi:hypothetical protein